MLNRYKKTSKDEGPRQEPGRSKAFKAAQQTENIFFSLEYEDFEAMFQGQRRFDAKFNIYTALSDCFKRGGGHSLTGALCCMGRLYSCCCSKRKRTGGKKKGPKKPEKVAPLDEENASEAIEGNESTLNEGEDEEETEIEPLKKVPENNLPLRDYVKLYGQLRKLDEQLNKEYEEEIRMLIHLSSCGGGSNIKS